MEVNAELLIGTRVRDIDGNKIGRIEEIRVERDEKSCVVDAYLIGASALIERLSAWTLVRPVAGSLHSRKAYSLYRVPWQDMDLTDPRRPRLRIARQDLRRAK